MNGVIQHDSETGTPGERGLTTLPEVIRDALLRMDLIKVGEAITAEPLTGGVASDIWHVRSASGEFCVKRALEKLRVARDWRVPTHRNAYEVAWLQIAAATVPGSVPQVLGHDPEAGVFAMQYFPAARYANWKSQLRNGLVQQQTAAGVAHVLAHLHAATADDPSIASQFDDGELFFQLRLEPYLHGAVSNHPDLAEQLLSLSDEVASNRSVLIHGDVSPKNILVGEGGIILLDAECAGLGDPAFDLAFCLNHLLLKTLWLPTLETDLLEAFLTVCRTYLAQVNWESPEQLNKRAARLIPGLLLARVDGKSPVEYLDPKSANFVRTFSASHLRSPPVSLEALAMRWQGATERWCQ